MPGLRRSTSLLRSSGDDPQKMIFMDAELL